jgi:phosphatidyl-myo-inositol dimannoside synthase
VLALTALRPRIIVFSHVGLARLGLVARCALPGVRVVTVIHGVEVWRPLPWLKRLSVQASTAVWSPSEHSRRMLHQWSDIALDRIRVLPWALRREDQARFAMRAEIQPEARTAPDGFKLLGVARLDAAEVASYRGKGIDDTLRCLPLVRAPGLRPTFDVVGDGTDRPRLESLTGQLDLSASVRFLGTVDDQQLARAYKECDVFVLPSATEGFGMVFLEAMAATKPVVAARAGGAEEVVLHGRTGLLVKLGDTVELADSLTRLAADNTWRRQLGEAGRRRFETHFTFDRFVGRVGSLLEDLR